MSLPIPRFKRLSVTIGQSNRRVSSSFNSALGFCARLFRRGLPHSMVIRRAGPDSRSGTPRKGRQKMKKHVLFVLLVLLFVAVTLALATEAPPGSVILEALPSPMPK